MGEFDPSATALLCDADLGESARELDALVRAVEGDACDLAIARFARLEGGGFGLALGYARRVVKDLGGFDLDAPISGQRAMRDLDAPPAPAVRGRLGPRDRE